VSAAVDVIEWGHERARTGSWRGHDRIAYLAPVPGGPAPSADFVRRCLGALGERGFHEVISAALAPVEQRGFLAAGFEVREHLLLLAHDLDGLELLDRDTAGSAPWRLRRARRADRPGVLVVDTLAFRPFWQLDEAALDEAVAATPSCRFRVAVGPLSAGDNDRDLMGYAVCGRAGRRGYVQRLAVHPRAQRAGLGRVLVLDGLRWMRRRGVDRAVVNTQPDNEAAIGLYRGLGFRLQPTGLDVLGYRLAR